MQFAARLFLCVAAVRNQQRTGVAAELVGGRRVARRRRRRLGLAVDVGGYRDAFLDTTLKDAAAPINSPDFRANAARVGDSLA